MDRVPDAMLQHRIQQRAFEIHETKANGSQLEDWLEAERQVLQEISHAHDGFGPGAGHEAKQSQIQIEDHRKSSALNAARASKLI